MFGLKKCPQDSSKLALLSQEEKGGALPILPPFDTFPMGPPLTRAAQQHPHQNSEAPRPLHQLPWEDSLWENINYKRRHVITLCLQRPPASSKQWNRPCCPSNFTSILHAHPHCLIRAAGDGSDVCPELPASSDLISPLMEEQICTPDTENHLVPVMIATSSASFSPVDTGHQAEIIYIHKA